MKSDQEPEWRGSLLDPEVRRKHDEEELARRKVEWEETGYPEFQSQIRRVFLWLGLPVILFFVVAVLFVVVGTLLKSFR